MDYYKILGVSENSDINEIKSKYRKLAFKYHPDRNPDNENAIIQFRKISEAYEVLGNIEKRMEYDKKREKSFKNGQSSKSDRKNSNNKEKRSYPEGRFSFHPEHMKHNFENFFSFKGNKKE